MKFAARLMLWASVGALVYAASAVATNLLAPEVDERLLTGDATGINLALAIGCGVFASGMGFLWRALQKAHDSKEALHQKRIEDQERYIEVLEKQSSHIERHGELMTRNTVMLERLERRIVDQ